MAINLKRREAFAKLFYLYPTALHSFASNNCSLTNPDTGEELKPSEGDIRAIEQLLIAQFAVRVLKSRAKGGTPAINWFCFEAADRYRKFKETHFGRMEVTASERYRMALTNLEQSFADTIFEALMSEAVYLSKEFDEGDFWHDVFLALMGLDSIKFAHPLSRIVLDHLQELKSALEEAPEVAPQ